MINEAWKKNINKQLINNSSIKQKLNYKNNLIQANKFKIATHIKKIKVIKQIKKIVLRGG